MMTNDSIWSHECGRDVNQGCIHRHKSRRIANQEWQFTTRKTKKLGGAPLTQSMMHSIFNNIFMQAISLTTERLSRVITSQWLRSKNSTMRKCYSEKGKHRHNSYVYAYASLIRCGECSCMINAKTNIKHVKSLNARKVYVHYYCTRRSEKPDPVLR